MVLTSQTVVRRRIEIATAVVDSVLTDRDAEYSAPRRRRPGQDRFAAPANHTPRSGKDKVVSSPSDAEVIGRSLDEPEVFGLIYDRHAPTVLRFLGRRVGAAVAEGLVGELFRIAFERRKTFDASRASALPWLYGIGSNLLLKHRRGEARRLRASARIAAADEAGDRRASAAALDARLLFPRVADAIETLPDGEREALLLFAWEDLRTRAWPRLSSCPSAPCARGSTAPARTCANCSSRAGKIG